MDRTNSYLWPNHHFARPRRKTEQRVPQPSKLHFPTRVRLLVVSTRSMRRAHHERTAFYPRLLNEVTYITFTRLHPTAPPHVPTVGYWHTSSVGEDDVWRWSGTLIASSLLVVHAMYVPPPLTVSRALTLTLSGMLSMHIFCSNSLRPVKPLTLPQCSASRCLLEETSNPPNPLSSPRNRQRLAC